jgi:SEC-C motif
VFEVNFLDKKIGRNDLCPCGSGKKYKKCCLNKVRGSQEKVLTKEDVVITGMDPSSVDDVKLKQDFEVVKASRDSYFSSMDNAPVYESIEEAFESIRKEGFIPVLEIKRDFDFGTYYEVALVCKHAYSEELRIFELTEDGKYEWTECGFNDPCPLCLEGVPSELTEEQVIDLYKSDMDL